MGRPMLGPDRAASRCENWGLHWWLLLHPVELQKKRASKIPAVPSPSSPNQTSGFGPLAKLPRWSRASQRLSPPTSSRRDPLQTGTMQTDERSSEEIMTTLSPWRHEVDLEPPYYVMVENTFEDTFAIYDANADLDLDSKNAALKSSETVVSIVSSIDEKIIFCASGTIIECNSHGDGLFDVILLTTASLLRRSNNEDMVTDGLRIKVFFWDGKSYEGEVSGCDFYYNLATVRIRSEVALKTAVFRDVDDCMLVCPNAARGSKETTKPTLRRHSKKFSLAPGDKVVAVGRHHTERYELMVSPGIFSADCCRLDCKELFRANCKITKCGIGGPLLNLDGEVIGINFIADLCTPFLPINVASRWWSHFKKYGQFSRPWLGMELTNLYSGPVDVLEHVVRKFPNLSKGVIIEKVERGSPACIAGLNPNDVIVQCEGKRVKSFLGLFKKIYGKGGQAIKLDVIRPFDGAYLSVSILVNEATRVNRWPIPRAHEYWKRRRQG